MFFKINPKEIGVNINNSRIYTKLIASKVTEAVTNKKVLGDLDKEVVEAKDRIIKY